MANVLIIGPAHPLRGGGITTFNQRLATEFLREGHQCSIASFSLQYPNFLFPGKSQFTDEPAPEGLRIRPLINSINPLNWLRVGRMLRRERPDLVVVRYWMPFFGPALGTILRLIRGNGQSRIVCIADNVIPHEQRFFDTPFTKYFLPSCDAFITMSQQVYNDLQQFAPKKPALIVPHPLYDSFGDRLGKDEARAHLGLPQQDRIILFFGFIRHYKGLDLLLQAMAEGPLCESGVTLLVAGEFYEDEKEYTALIDKLGLHERVILHNRFMADAEIRYYLCAADFVVQPYRSATQSGVTPLAYYFERPMVVTNVGGLPDLVPDHRCGIVCAPEPLSIAEAVAECYRLGEDFFVPQIREEKKKYAWSKLTSALFRIVGISS
ncbi:glycosyltransferase [Flaviaesturariibacter aridisoli]|uniref:Glycosyltransferase n=1 Tax=Flaviaesturariibacter aridisoli TaxID=2545761 RepID=A0A4R4DZ43_9BACT|nr:glycosyltransferase [Flaviaesturariibacter aridisoli]TCZ69029.1 glycosyltransferase [Flaviaesturariibacter aridisoli]